MRRLPIALIRPLDRRPPFRKRRILGQFLQDFVGFCKIVTASCKICSRVRPVGPGRLRTARSGGNIVADEQRQILRHPSRQPVGRACRTVRRQGFRILVQAGRRPALSEGSFSGQALYGASQGSVTRKSGSSQGSVTTISRWSRVSATTGRALQDFWTDA